jgi:ParB-like chromosome segregation protein Spo0J
MNQKVEDAIAVLVEAVAKSPVPQAVELLNRIKVALHEVSPMKNEPVDCVLWVNSELVEANDYNPNSVAPPEMELLRHSVREDGYTQPIVSWKHSELAYEVVDGFHRNRVGKECPDVRERIHGYLPLTIINAEREDRSDRIASTIRHNRARGKHAISSMSQIVVELKRRNWSDAKIGKELGMDPDEVLRLSQISGLRELFDNRDFAEAWESDDVLSEEEQSEGND